MVPRRRAEGGELLGVGAGCCCPQDILYSSHCGALVGELGHECWGKMGTLWWQAVYRLQFM